MNEKCLIGFSPDRSHIQNRCGNTMKTESVCLNDHIHGTCKNKFYN